MGTFAETQILDRVELKRRELGIPVQQIADNTSIARTTLQRLLADGDNFSVRQLKLVSHELGVPFLSWFEEDAA